MIYFGSGTSFQTGNARIVFSGVKNIDIFPDIAVPKQFTIGGKKIEITGTEKDPAAASVYWDVDLSVDPGQRDLALTLSDISAAITLFPGILAAGPSNITIEPGVSEWFLLGIAAVVVLVLVLFFHFKK